MAKFDPIFGTSGIKDFFLGKPLISTLNPEQQQVNTALGSRLSGLLNAPSQFQGDLNVPISQGEQGVVDQFAGLQEGAFSRLNSLINPSLNEFNTQFRQELVQPSFRTFREEIQPLIEESLPSFSTARGRAVERGAQQLGDRLLQQRFGLREGSRDRSLAAISGAGQFGTTAAGIAGIPRSIQQAGLNKQFESFIAGNPQLRSSITSALTFLGIDTQATDPNDPLARLIASLGTAAKVGAAAGGA